MRFRPRPRTRASLTILLSGALLVPVAALSSPPASAACASQTTRSISGYVLGNDNRDVNVSIGFAVRNSSGVTIDARPGSTSYGCKSATGYSLPQLEVNRYIGSEGVAAGSPMYDYAGTYKGRTVRTWRLTNLPSNAHDVWIEVYSRRYRNTACAVNGVPCPGVSDTHKYGNVMRRSIPVGATGVMLKLSRNCNYGGSNGAIAGTVKNKSGQSITPSRSFAWSTAADSNTAILGWGGALMSSGSYRVSALAPSQYYVVWMTYNGVTQKRTGVRVYGCTTTHANFVF